MAVRYVSDRFVGSGNEIKPLDVLDGALFHEIDTLIPYLKVSGAWVALAGGSGGSSSINQLTGTYFFTQDIPSGVNNLFIPYPALLNASPSPKTIVGIRNDITTNMLACQTSGHCSSGFWLNLSATTTNTGYTTNIIACNSNLTGLGLTIINQITTGGGGSGTPGGINKSIQFNTSGSFDGVSGLLFDKTNGVLSLLRYVDAGDAITAQNNLQIIKNSNQNEFSQIISTVDLDDQQALFQIKYGRDDIGTTSIENVAVTNQLYFRGKYRTSGAWNFEPTIADSPGNIAYEFNTSNPLVNPDLRLTSFKNNGIENFGVTVSGLPVIPYRANNNYILTSNSGGTGTWQRNSAVPNIISITADYNVVPSDDTIIVLPGSGDSTLYAPVNINFFAPSITNSGNIVTISKPHKFKQLVTISGANGNIFDNTFDFTYSLKPYESAMFQTDGVSWYLLSRGSSDEFADIGTIISTGTWGITAIDLPNGTTAAGIVHWGAEINNNIDFQSICGVTSFAIINKGGSFYQNLTTNIVSKITTAGTVSIDFSGAAALPRVQIYATPTTSLTGTTQKIKFKIDIFANTAVGLSFDAG